MAEDCVFCKIVSGKIPSTKLFEGATVLSFLDIAPAAKGHALVIPKKHCASLLGVPHEELMELIVAVQKVAAAVMKATKADGFNVLESNEKAAGQVIPHVHFHVIPRWAGDNLNLGWEQGTPDKAELEALAKLVKKHL